MPAALAVPHLAADNWAVALTDIARLVRAAQPEEAYECLQAAAHKYAQSLAVHPNNPQASNNWGLVLQDLSSLRPAGERAAYLHHSLQKFRRALRLRPDFDRACYNLGGWALERVDAAVGGPLLHLYAAVICLGFVFPVFVWAKLHASPTGKPRPLPSIGAGTVLYSHACSLQEALLASQEQQEAAQLLTGGSNGSSSARRGGSGSAGMASSPVAARAAAAASERAIQSTFAHAAQYIAGAYALQPGKPVYSDSLAAVQRLLPLPHLRSGPLLAVHPATADTPGEQWVSCWLALSHEGLQAVRPPVALAAGQQQGLGQGQQQGQGQGLGMPSVPPAISYKLSDVADARMVCDPSLPAGAAFWLALYSKPRWVRVPCHSDVMVLAPNAKS
jgi:hypothetical protein